MHIWWNCSWIKPFWQFIQNHIRDLTGINLQFHPRLFDFDYFGIKLQIPIAHLLLAALVLIDKKWKTNFIPTVDEWLSRIRFLFLMCKLTAISKYRSGTIKALDLFSKQWNRIASAAILSFVSPEMSLILI